MGAEAFTQLGWGHTPEKAFDDAWDKAAYDHGHSGYTGSMAEKSEFALFKDVPLCAPAEAEVFAEEFTEQEDPRVSDKWGPAGCIKTTDREEDGRRCYVFFGWASS